MLGVISSGLDLTMDLKEFGNYSIWFACIRVALHIKSRLCLYSECKVVGNCSTPFYRVGVVLPTSVYGSRRNK